MHDIRAIRENPAGFRCGAVAPGPVADVDRRCSRSTRRGATQILAAETAQAEQNRREQGGGRGQGAGRRGGIPAAARAGGREEGRDRPADRGGGGRGCAAARSADGHPEPPARRPCPRVATRRTTSRSTAGAIPRNFDFTPKEHFEIAGVKPGMDFETAAKLSGSRFVVLAGRGDPGAPGAGAVHARHPCRTSTG